jgi:hypothetical protein
MYIYVCIHIHVYDACATAATERYIHVYIHIHVYDVYIHIHVYDACATAATEALLLEHTPYGRYVRSDELAQDAADNVCICICICMYVCVRERE